MTGENSWLKAVAEVLRADTGDLRSLVKIAGVDPETAFIGTSLNGADVSGQDLRGMILTHFDISKVKRDEKTLVDDANDLDVEAPYDLGPLAIVLVYGSTSRRDSLKKRLSTKLDLYYPGEESAFLDAAKTFRGPKFVVNEVSTKYFTLEQMGSFPSNVIHLVVRRGAAANILDFSDRLRGKSSGPVVFIPTVNMGGFGLPSLLSGAVGDFIEIVCDGWAYFKEALKKGQILTFIRGRGIAPDAASDAWCRVLSVAERNDLLGSKGYRLISTRAVTADAAGVSKALFPRLNEMPIDGTALRSPANFASVLLRYEDRAHSPETYYQEGIVNLLKSRGWRVRSDKNSSKRGSFADDLYLSGDAWSGHAEISSARSAVRQMHIDERSTNVHFDEIRELVISESATPKNIISLLVHERRLLVNASDLCRFHGKGHDLWRLVESQALRLARGANSLDKTQYFMGLLSVASRRRMEASPPFYDVQDIISDPDFFLIWKVVETPSRARSDRTIFGVLLDGPDRRGRRSGGLRITLSIGEQGPHIEGVIDEDHGDGLFLPDER